VKGTLLGVRTPDVSIRSRVSMGPLDRYWAKRYAHTPEGQRVAARLGTGENGSFLSVRKAAVSNRRELFGASRAPVTDCKPISDYRRREGALGATGTSKPVDAHLFR
jgi:hypothetical protein